MRVRKLLNIIFISLSALSVTRAEIPHGVFTKDNVQVGEPVDFVLTHYSSQDSLVLFPDTLYDFSPFELVTKKTFQSAIRDSLKFDSVIYTLRTFEIRGWQHFNLPVYYLTKSDSIKLTSTTDSLGINLLVKKAITPISLKSDTKYQPIPLLTDYAYLSVLSMVVLASIIILIVVFRKPLIRKIRLLRLQQQHDKYITRINALVKENPSRPEIESFLGIWKSYLGNIEKKTVASMTSKEILNIYPDAPELKSKLQLLDRSLYAGELNEGLESTLKSLRDFSIDRFTKKKTVLGNE